MNERDALSHSLKQLSRESSIKNALTHKQMQAALNKMELSIRQINLLGDACQALLVQHEIDLQKAEKVQEFKAKIYNLSKELGIPLNSVYASLQRLSKQATLTK